MQDLAGKVAVITGGASGIGHAMASRFAKDGMKLVLADVEAGPLAAAAEAFEADGVEVLAQQLDVSDAAKMDALAERVLERFGAVHVLCNNAGVGSGGPMWELTTEDWEFCMRPNLWGVIHGVRVFVKQMVAQNEGHIVNTASMAGLISVPGMGPYNVTKHGVVTLSETLYHELQGLGSKVGVSVLCPGHVSTRIWESDRNRPDELSPARVDMSSEEMVQTREMYRQILATSLAAERVAELVYGAVLDGTFYILTHDNARAEVEKRMQAILDGKPPAMPEGGPAVFSGGNAL
ncbi:MAG: SDR family NAD(P)-dependent oxidoreductase [Deltaproteobacteria bacterium]|nr:SDR family NAD(P)-dependent oxidoreductase [Deltaproteobacteria bacterium]